MKKTLIIGASPDPLRFSYKMCKSLLRHGYEPVLLGIRDGEISGIPILHGKPELENIHTVCLYLNLAKQSEYYNYIIDLAPRRIIFNPGTHNPGLINLAQKEGIECVSYCSLIMLSKAIY
jgi:predicted CoA-binding protein